MQLSIYHRYPSPTDRQTDKTLAQTNHNRTSATKNIHIPYTMKVPTSHESRPTHPHCIPFHHHHHHHHLQSFRPSKKKEKKKEAINSPNPLTHTTPLIHLYAQLTFPHTAFCTTANSNPLPLHLTISNPTPPPPPPPIHPIPHPQIPTLTPPLTLNPPHSRPHMQRHPLAARKQTDRSLLIKRVSVPRCGT